MNRVGIGLIIVLLALGAAEASFCPDWGVYAGEAEPLWNGYSWLGGTPRQSEADVFKVGKLDGNNLGPFANKSASEIALLWPLLRSAKVDYGKEYVQVDIPNTCASTIKECTEYGWVSVLFGVPTWDCIKSSHRCVLETTIQAHLISGEVLAEQIVNEDPFLVNLVDRLGQDQYEAALNRYVGLIDGATAEVSADIDRIAQLNSFIDYVNAVKLVGTVFFDNALATDAPYKYKADVLAAQLAAEIDTSVISIKKKIDLGASEVIIEVANEPNLFPYIPANLYAKYYVDWVHAIKDGMKDYQAPHAYELKFMPGGLADVNSMEAPLRELLSHGVSFSLLGWKLGFSQKTDDIAYYNEFLNSADAYEKAKYGGSGVKELIDYGNVHLYPMSRVDKASQAPVTLADLAADYDEKMQLLASNSKSGKIIVSEYGNITPFAEQVIVDQVMTPLVEYIGSRSDVKSAYWFKAKGIDEKYSNLGNVPGSATSLGKSSYYSVANAMGTLKQLFEILLPTPDIAMEGGRQVIAAADYMTQYKQDLDDGHPDGPDKDDDGNDVLAAFAQLCQNGQYTQLGDTYKKLTGTCFLTNTELPSGNPAGFVPRATGSPRILVDPELKISSGVVGGYPVTQFSQSNGDWNFQHTFVFDENWAAGNFVDVEIYIDPADLADDCWLGTLRMTTFDGFKWLELPEDPSGKIPSVNDLNLARGKWQTMRFRYNPAQYQLGQNFDLIFFVNAYRSVGAGMKFSIGKVSIASSGQPVEPNPSTDEDEPQNPGVNTNGKALDALTGLTNCNQCTVVDVGSRTAIAVVPNGGGNVIEFNVVADQELVDSRKISLDIKTDFTPESWSQVYFIAVDPSANRYWDETRADIPASTNLAWTTVQAEFNGQNYRVGDVLTIKVSLNTNVPNGKNIYVSDLRWDP